MICFLLFLPRMYGRLGVRLADVYHACRPHDVKHLAVRNRFAALDIEVSPLRAGGT